MAYSRNNYTKGYNSKERLVSVSSIETDQETKNTLSADQSDLADLKVTTQSIQPGTMLEQAEFKAGTGEDIEIGPDHIPDSGNDGFSLAGHLKDVNIFDCMADFLDESIKKFADKLEELDHGFAVPEHSDEIIQLPKPEPLAEQITISETLSQRSISKLRKRKKLRWNDEELGEEELAELEKYIPTPEDRFNLVMPNSNKTVPTEHEDQPDIFELPKITSPKE